MPKDVRELCRDLRRISTARGVIPRAAMGHAATLLDDYMLHKANLIGTIGDDRDARSSTRGSRRERENSWRRRLSARDADCRGCLEQRSALGDTATGLQSE